MSVADKLRAAAAAVNPSKVSPTVAETAAAEVAELISHIGKVTTEGERRNVTVVNMEHQLTEMGSQRNLLRARLDRALATSLDNREELEKDLADLEARQADLNSELAKARDDVTLARLAIPDLQRRLKAAQASVVNERRRENFSEFDELLPQLEALYRQAEPIRQRLLYVANREAVLAGDPAVFTPRTDYVSTPSLIPPVGGLGPDMAQQAQWVRQFRDQLGKLPDS